MGGMECAPVTPTCPAEATADTHFYRVSAFLPRYLVITVPAKGSHLQLLHQVSVTRVLLLPHLRLLPFTFQSSPTTNCIIFLVFQSLFFSSF